MLATALALPVIVTACSNNSPKTASAATASAAAQASSSLVTACNDLAGGWDSSDTTLDQTISRLLAGSQAGTDFNHLLSDNSSGDTAAATSAANALSADCGNAGVSLTITTTDPNGKTCPTLDAAGYCPGDEPATMTRQVDTVVFKVWGSGLPSIQYGSDSDSRSPPGGYGPLGDGNALPWSGPMTYNSSALYYALTAQLEGSGDISDSVTEVITTYCSNGTHKTESFPLANGHASGGYNIAQAEYAGGDTGNSQQAESDAGC